jgi:hypothetical protein
LAIRVPFFGGRMAIRFYDPYQVEKLTVFPKVP